MHFKTLAPENYKSFDEPQTVPFGRGFNVIVGQNNSGKSALLQACNIPTLVNIPHRNSSRYRAHQLRANSEVAVEVCLTGAEFFDALQATGPGQWIPAPPVSSFSSQEYANRLISFETLTFRALFRSGAAVQVSDLPEELSEHSPEEMILLTANTNGELSVSSRQHATSTLPAVITSAVQGKVYGFKAERFNVGKFTFQDIDKLAPDASNLPAVLNFVQGHNPELFNQINSHMREIFPSIRMVSVGPNKSDLIINIWTEGSGPSKEHAVELNDSGTGVGQALAILTAASMTQGGVIIIDELSSFLHPQAVKALINILRSDFPQHQYIVSTHTFDVIRWSVPDVVGLVRHLNGESKVKIIDTSDVSHLRETASDLGFEVSDVFGSDRICWVEGQTEEDCFPFVARHYGVEIPTGMTFIALNATSPFESVRGAKAALEIYERLSRASSPFSRGIVVTLDREGLTDEAVTRLESAEPGRLVIASRRTFENYLIAPHALAQILSNELDAAGGSPGIETSAVASWLQEHGGDKKFKGMKTWSGNLTGDGWIVEVDGASLLADLFSDLTEARIEYRKRRHGLELVQWIAQNDPDFMQPLVSHVRRTVDLLRAADW